MITLVISGGQTGADQAGWRAAQACGIETAGWMPLYFQTENGTDGSLGRLYNAKTLPTKSYRARTFKNVQESDGTIWFGSTDTPGAKATLNACKSLGRPLMLVIPNGGILPLDVLRWICTSPRKNRLNISGNRESENPGIGKRVERFLMVVFKRVKERDDS
jgi:hypothetical protein